MEHEHYWSSKGAYVDPQSAAQSHQQQMHPSPYTNRNTPHQKTRENPFQDPPSALQAGRSNAYNQPRKNQQHSNTAARQESGVYDSFINGYIDLYDKKESERPPVIEENEMSYHSTSRGGQRGDRYDNYDSSQDPFRNHSQHNNQPHWEQSRNHNHSPYRDSPSPELHPGMTLNNNNPYGWNSQSQQNHSYSSHNSNSNSNSNSNPNSNFASTPSKYSHNHSSYNLPHNENMYHDGGYGQDHYNVGYNQQNSPYATSNRDDHSPYNSNDRMIPHNGDYSSAASSNSYGSRQQQHQRQYGGNFPNDNYTPGSQYRNPFDAHSISRDDFSGMDFVDANAITDDGDHDVFTQNQPKRKSILNHNRRSGANYANPPSAIAAGSSAAALAGGSTFNSNANNGALANGSDHAAANQSQSRSLPEKSSETNFKNSGNGFADEPKSNSWKKILFIVLALVVLAGVGAGVTIGVLQMKKQGDNSSSGASSNDANPAGLDGPDFTIDSPAVKALMNNKKLHKVFPGMAYTPMNVQYPDCLHNPPLQNNITLDMVILSQLTNVLRLYGTDCGQTEMVLKAIDNLKLTDMKIWAGVWLDGNSTTNDRQVSQFHDILKNPNSKYIKGVAVGNEVLYGKTLTLTQLTSAIDGVKADLVANGYHMPVASSDLGSAWTSDFVESVDTLMANIHPFFGGVPVQQAAGWTWNFWQQVDVPLTQGTNKENIVSEVGWPSQGGNDCSPAECAGPTDGAVAGIPELQIFLDTYVCQSLANGTNYFYFEAFDEPWKVRFNTPGQAWEDHWGLFDVNRNLKPGLTIPSCPGLSINPA